jgi:GNAT superfamily N-acetyltransferase
MGLRDFKRSSGVPKAIVVRPGGDREVNVVKDLDLKSYHYPWGVEEWQATAGDDPAKWCLAFLKNKPTGFAIWRDTDDEVDLLRIGVRPDSRRRGVGTELLSHVVKYAEMHGMSRVALTVPEINCFPGHPDDVSEWLLHRKFRAAPPIVKAHAYRYGQWVDGFRFVRTLGGDDGTTA